MKTIQALTVTAPLVEEAGAFLVIDVGARRAATPIWKNFAEQGASIDFVGFEPDSVECAALNAQPAAYRHKSYPVALGRAREIRKLFVPEFNHAASSFYPDNPDWRGQRFVPKLLTGDFRQAVDAPQAANAGAYVDIEVTSLDAFALEHGITSFDFLKVDVEGAELEVLQGAATLLESQPAAAVEVEVMFAPFRVAPLFDEITAFMRSVGYQLYDVDLHRYARAFAPSAPAGNWTNHRGQEAFGPSVHGQIVHGDALFVRDPIMARTSPDHAKVLRAACILDLHGFADCAAELLQYYDLGERARVAAPNPTLRVTALASVKRWISRRIASDA